MKIEQLEARRMLSAAVTAALPDVTSGTQFVALNPHFSDSNTYVRLSLVDGSGLGTDLIDLKLYDQNTPLTVQNFLNYVNNGLYDGAFFYRSIPATPTSPAFILQAGSYNADNGDASDPITPFATIPNEFSTDVTHNGEVNVQGTIAMAKVSPLDQNGNPEQGGGPGSAAADFFINLSDNASNLDNQNGGFTTFGEVVGDTFQTVQAISNLPTFDVTPDAPFTDLPVVNYSSGTIELSNLVTINTARVIPLSYSAVSDNPGLVAVSVTGGALALSYPGSGTGTAHITVTATSYDGSTATSTFMVTSPGGTVADTVAPTAAASAPIIKNDDSQFDFNVTYDDDVALDGTTLGNDDLVVTGPGGFSEAAKFVTATAQTNGEIVATYNVTPTTSFVNAQSGNFIVSANPSAVADAAGNPLPAGPIGTLNLSFPDEVAPTATASGLTLNSGNGSFKFNVDYHDDVAILAATLRTGNVTVTGPNSFSAQPTLVTTTIAQNGDTIATYQVNAPNSGTFTSGSSGTYTVTMNSTQVSDTSGNIIPAGMIGALALDLTPPTVAATGGVAIADGNGSFTFSVTYQDNFAVNTATFDNNDITVTGPNAFSQAATFAGFVAGASNTVVATYRISANGVFQPAQSGQYTIVVNSGQVTDSAGLAVAAGSAGALTINFPTPNSPTASASNATIAAQNASFTFIVNFHSTAGLDVSTLGDDDFTVTGPNSFSAPAHFVVSSLVNGIVDVQAIYRVTPRSAFTPAQCGSYSIVANAGKVLDEAQTPLDAGTVSTLNLTFPDLIAPTATLGAATIASGNSSFTFTVSYHDNVAINVASIDNLDLMLVAPDGATGGAALVSTSGTGQTVVATYRVNGVGGTFTPNDDGAYSVSIVSGQVTDTAGNAVAAGSAGSLTLTFPNLVTPTGTATGATIDSGNASFSFTATYTDDVAINGDTLGDSNLTVTGPNGFSEAATLVFAEPPGNGASAIYRVASPSGAFTHAESGNYIVSVNVGSLTDISGSSVAAGPIGTFALTFPDLIAPTASASGGTIAAGSTSFTFTVAYHDDTAIDTSTLDNNDLIVQGPEVSATAQLISTSGSGADVTATYRVNAGTAFQPANSGTFTVTANAAQISDTAGNSVAAGAIGTFSLTFPKLAPKPDLMGTIKSVSPASLVAGAKGQAVISVKNGGTAALSGNVTITLYAATGTDGSHVGSALGTLKTALTLAIGASKNVTIPFTAPQNLQQGSYHLVAVLDSAKQVSELNELNNSVVSAQTVNLVPAFVDLKTAILGRVPNIIAKKPTNLSLLLTNNGNTAANGPAMIKIYESPDQLHDHDRLLATVAKTINVPAGKSAVIPLTFTPAADLAGMNYLLVSVVYNGKPSEKNPADNSIFSTTVVTFK